MLSCKRSVLLGRKLRLRPFYVLSMRHRFLFAKRGIYFIRMQKNTPKQFVIQLGALIALYVSITALTVLVFSIINLKFPDESYYWEGEGAREAIRTCMAILLVFFPTYIGLTRLSNQSRRRENNGEYIAITRWLIYFSLLVAGGILLADLVTLINYFLNGEITTRFLYKVFALFLIVGSAFHYYVLDVRGFFNSRVQSAMQFAIGATVLVAAALAFGFQYIETPSEVREQRLDEQQVMDLQSMQSYVENYYVTNRVLPATLNDAYDGIPLPTAPTGRAAYRYEVTGDTNYKLCAAFSAPSRDIENSYAVAPDRNFNWSHQAGDWCFERTAVTPLEEKMLLP